MSGRTIAIGDIHGCAQALQAVLDAVQPTADDRLVVLGDYVDRGPDSRVVVEQLLRLAAHCQLVTLLGNHEQMMIRSLDSESYRAGWIQFGGQQTLASYGGEVSAIPPEHREFLRRSRLWYETEGHFFVHANYVADVPLDQQDEAVLLWRHLTRSIPAPHQSGKIAIVGHTPQISGEILDRGHLLGIDTYCFGGRWLTALEVDTRQIWQANSEGVRRARTNPSERAVGESQ